MSQEKKTKSGKKDIISLLAVIFGLLLIGLSTYQVVEMNFTNSELAEEQELYDQLETEIENLLEVEEIFTQVQTDFENDDYFVQAMLDNGKMDEIEANITIDTAVWRYNTAILKFKTLLTDGSTKLTLKPEYDKYFVGGYAAVEVDLTGTDLTGQTLYDLSEVLDYDDWEHVNINDVPIVFTYNASLHFFRERGIPIERFTVDKHFTDNMLVGQEKKIDGLQIKVDELSFGFDVNTIAILIIGFFIDFEDGKKWLKYLYLASAALLIVIMFV